MHPFMKRLRELATAHPAVMWTSLVVAVAAVVFVIVWFQPQKLVIDETADEALPSAESTGPVDDENDGSSSRTRPQTFASGSFQSLEHTTSGTAEVIALPDGRRFLRFEGLETSNGPDLRVYLSEVPASDDWYAYGEDYVDLGGLKANLGDQNYEIPEEVDLDKYRSAVIWCRRFSVGFGVAPLEAS